MKHHILMLLLSSSLLCACNNTETAVSSSRAPSKPYYEEVESYHIHWDDLFAQEGNPYYCYIYGLACNACSSLREQATTLAQSSNIPFYFIYPNDDIPFVEAPAIAESSLGATTLDGVSCYSTPTLIEITDHTVTEYLRDYYQIKDFIEAHL